MDTVRDILQSGQASLLTFEGLWKVGDNAWDVERIGLRSCSYSWHWGMHTLELNLLLLGMGRSVSELWAGLISLEEFIDKARVRKREKLSGVLGEILIILINYGFS